MPVYPGALRFAVSGRAVHGVNVPSPAATASIVIGREIVKMAEEKLGLGANAQAGVIAPRKEKPGLKGRAINGANFLSTASQARSMR